MDRKRIGLLVLGGYDWVGGLYYTLNLIKSLNVLPENEKPEIFAFWGNDIALKHLEELNYPFLHIHPYNKSGKEKYLSKASQLIFGSDPRAKRLINEFKLDGIYPYNYPVKVDTDKKVVAWFPDFQHKFLPHLFTEKDVNQRDEYLDKIQTRIKDIVFSSHTAQNHYKKYYPESSLIQHVVQFCSVIDFQLPEISDLKEKYSIEKPFFLVSNQFWKHKNHLVVFKSVERLLEKGNLDFDIIFTGKEEDPRNPNYMGELRAMVENKGLGANMKFLGFISREDQLGLMRGCLAVIQPSYFEGWGTVVEDAKTLNVQTIASDIEIHHEQLEDNAYYFGKDDFEKLADILSKYAKGEIKQIHHYQQLEERLMNTAKSVVRVFE